MKTVYAGYTDLEYGGILEAEDEEDILVHGDPAKEEGNIEQAYS
jgi:hypothetical protein